MNKAVARTLLVTSMAALAASLAACGAGGGSGAQNNAPTPPAQTVPTPSPPPPPPPSPAPPGLTTAEFRTNYGLEAIHAEVPFALGYSGRGIVVALIDDGIDFNQPDIRANISPFSFDSIPGRNQPAAQGDQRHGTWMAGALAAERNGFGEIGVAYRATILSIRADRPDQINSPTCGGSRRCFIRTDLTRAVNDALDRGARVISMSIGYFGDQNFFNAQWEAALTRLVSLNAVLILPSGNESASQPVWPARYAADPRFAGHVIAVGSFDRNFNISGFSNAAATTANNFLLAPGDVQPIECLPGGFCLVQAGTSLSVPHVAGSIALLMEAFPNLNPRQAMDILLRSARDGGAPGPDPIFGRGYLDLQRAFQLASTGSLPN